MLCTEDSGFRDFYSTLGPLRQLEGLRIGHVELLRRWQLELHLPRLSRRTPKPSLAH